MKIRSILIFFLIALAQVGQAQIINPTHWSFSSSGKSMKEGTQTELIFKVKIDGTWHLYSNDFDPKLGPKVTVFNFNKTKDKQAISRH
jgi:thiol:disulfide interchange protein DsbD